MIRELRETLNHLWNRLRRTESWIYGMSQMPLIIEEGTSIQSGITWRYRKWSTGVAECWGVWSGTLTHYATVFGGYGYTTTLTFPLNLFIEPPITTDSAKVGNGFAVTGTRTDSVTKDSCTYYIVGSASNSQSVKIYTYVIGKWKETTNTPKNFIDLLYDKNVWNYNYLDNLPKINGQTVSGNKTLADYGFTGEIANDKVGYTTEVPTEDNIDGLKFVVLDEDPATKYNGWIYIITE